MKRTFLPFALGAVMFSALVTPSHGASSPAPAAPAKQHRLYKITELKSPEQVQEFQHNVQVLQAEREGAVELQASIEKDKNAQKKKELQAKFDAATKKLTEDNAQMFKIYGFSLARNYTMEIVSANIYTEVSDEEAAKIEKAEKAKK
jgi:hypothetical protein